MKRRLPITAMMFITFLVLISCKKSDSAGQGNEPFTATVSFHIDGDNFHEQSITIKGIPKTTTWCTYSSIDKTTVITINDQPDINTAMKNQFFLIFNGSVTGTQHAGDEPNGGTFSSLYFQISVTDKDGVLHPYLFENAANTPGIFTITKYGKPGETVDGNFSGTLIDENGDPVMKISAGSFSITRTKDID